MIPGLRLPEADPEAVVDPEEAAPAVDPEAEGLDLDRVALVLVWVRGVPVRVVSVPARVGLRLDRDTVRR